MPIANSKMPACFGGPPAPAKKQEVKAVKGKSLSRMDRLGKVVRDNVGKLVGREFQVHKERQPISTYYLCPSGLLKRLRQC